MRIRVAQTPSPIAACSKYERLRRLMYPDGDLGCDTASQQSEMTAPCLRGTKDQVFRVSHHLNRTSDVPGIALTSISTAVPPTEGKCDVLG